VTLVSPRDRAARTLAAISDGRTALRLFGVRAWLLAAAGSIVTAIAVGVPTVLIPNPWFTRMTPVRPQDYVIWVTTLTLSGLLIGSFAIPAAERTGEAKAVSAGALAYLAVGCPVCNKVVVLLLGTAGALTFFAPVQLYLGIASLGLLAWALHLRARALVGACEARVQ
jgi:hypothetical protein